MHVQRRRGLVAGQRPYAYQPFGARFDGTNDSLLGTGLTTADATRLVLSMFWRRTGGDGGIRFMCHTASSRFFAELTASNSMLIQARNAAGTPIWQHNGGIYTGDSDWHHTFAYLDTTSALAGFVLEDGADASNIVTETAGTMNTGQTTWAVGATTAAGARWVGDLAELWIGDPGRDVVAADAERFMVNGRARNLGADGSAPFGVQPMFYFRGDHNAFGVNSGSAGDLTVTGALTAPQYPIRL